MTKYFLLLILFIVFFQGSGRAQESAGSKHELRGVIRDQNSAVIPGLSLMFKYEAGEIISLTGINGEFRVMLPDGNFVLTSDAIPNDKFRAFIRLSSTAINPDFLTLTLDSTSIRCSAIRDHDLPGIVSYTEPAYPPAARAVRAGGEVSVDMRVRQDGRVSSAKAISGHPLLKRASELSCVRTKRNGPREVILHHFCLSI